MATKLWAPGEFITPGDLRQPRTAPPVVTSAIPNGGFETGDLTDWTVSNPAITVVAHVPFEGTYVVRHPDGLLGTYFIDSDNIVPVLPGQSITAGCRYFRETNVNGRQSMNLIIRWFTASMVEIGTGSQVAQTGGASSVWYNPQVTGVAPAGAAFAQFRISSFQTGTGGTHHQYFDACYWNYVQPVAQAGLVYRAVQADAGFTAATEPVWPLILGNTVVDNEVTWEAVLASNVTWEATPILLSGATEPAFPVEVGATVLDNTVVWKAISRRVTDTNCPNTKAVTIAASKIFAGDRDIIKYCATVNPLDWTTKDDAGYLPFGLQAYGANDVAALGLYRSNLIAFNSQGFQMWQVDQDPANMAFLDAVRVSCTFVHSLQPVANDLLFLNIGGARNVSVAGASTNIQADGVGEPIDPLVKAEIKLLSSPDDALSLFWPAAGQYWIIFGVQAFVLTINGVKKKSWSRYTFPQAITDATLDGDTLVLRTENNLVWELDEDALFDDTVPSEGVITLAPGSGSAFGFSGVGYADDGVSTYGSITGTYAGEEPAAIFDREPEFEIHYLYIYFPGTHAQDFFTSVSVETDQGIQVFNSVDADFSTTAGYTVWLFFFPDGPDPFSLEGSYEITFLGADDGLPIEGTVWWPYLDMGAPGREKGLVGLDLVCDAPTGVSVSIGYNQNDRAQRTADYAVSADTLTGKMVPFPVSGPSFDLKLTFEPGQAWEWSMANLYVQDWRTGS